MDWRTIRRSTMAAVRVAGLGAVAPAFAEGGRYEKPAHPVDSDARLPAVIRFEQFLYRHGIRGLNNVQGPTRQPAAPSKSAQQPPQPAASSPPTQAAQPAAPPPAQPAAVESAPSRTSVVEEPLPRAPSASTTAAPVPSAARAPVRAETPPAPAEDAVPEPLAAEAPVAVAAPVQEAAALYAPPKAPPWWERLLSSREFLWATAFCLIVTPLAALIAASILGRRREERDLVLYD